MSKLLIACEESQRVCAAFRKKGWEAYSCDIVECSGGHPEWHILGDALEALNGGCITTMDGNAHMIDQWDMLIAHPPCTYLSSVTSRHLSLRKNPAGKVVGRMWKLADAAVFFMRLMLADVPMIAVENPLGYMSRLYRKPDQIIHPYYFASGTGDESYEKKRTCLWLKNLPCLVRTSNLPPPEPHGYTASGKALNWEESITKNRAVVRSRTFPAIADAMAEQWSAYAEKERNQHVQA